MLLSLLKNTNPSPPSFCVYWWFALLSGSASFISPRPLDFDLFIQGWVMCHSLDGSWPLMMVFLGGLATFFFFFLFFFSGPHLRHMEVPGLGTALELQLLAYAPAAEKKNLSHVCGLHCSSRQCRILNPLSKARDRTHISWIRICFLIG